MLAKSENDLVQNFVFYMNVYVDGIISIGGLIGNLLIFILLRNSVQSGSNSIYLRSLAIVEFIFLIYCLLYTTFRTAAKESTCVSSFLKIEEYLIAYSLPIGWMMQTSGIWLTAVIAVDRRIAIEKPFKSLRFCTAEIALKVSSTQFMRIF